MCACVYVCACVWLELHEPTMYTQETQSIYTYNNNENNKVTKAELQV